MKVLAITLLALVGVVTSRNPNFEDVIDLEQNTAYGYHRKYGIPLADEIRETEARGESARIVGGTAARLGAYPYQVGLILTLPNFEVSVCGGAILNVRRVLTAAHCWWDGEIRARQYIAIAGALGLFNNNGGQSRTGTDVVLHVNWNPRSLANDIALIYLSPSFIFTVNVNSIALPSAAETSLSFAGAAGTVTGYGRTSDTGGVPQNTDLKFVSAPVITNAVCKQTLSSVTDSNICTRTTAGRSPCLGDSGGPLMVTSNNRSILIGVVSFGTLHCTEGRPVAYARVTSFRNWITSRL